MLLAGHETSASALSWLLRELAGDADLQRRLRTEILQSDEIDVRNAADGSLLRSVINEILRLYPPIPLYARDATAPDMMEDTAIRPGALILVSSWLIHRHTRLWDDPVSFKPDRFRSLSTSDTSTRFLPFGSGPRGCPGSRFAMIEMQALVSGIVRAFQLRAASGAVARPLGNLTTRPDREIHIALDPVRGDPGDVSSPP
jgi:cytochrome P450